MKILYDNFPSALKRDQETLGACLKAFDSVSPLSEVYLFGSFARGDATSESDVDLCLVSEGASNQLHAAKQFRRSIRGLRPKPAFTLIPISPERLAEKRESKDHFFQTVLNEGILLAAQD